VNFPHKPVSAYLAAPCAQHPHAPAPGGQCVLCEGSALARAERNREAARQRHLDKQLATKPDWSAKFGPRS
jgi:hypothetical protein